jgi:pimeloyl-ACP methyl ester carboxylesterase
MFRIERFVPGRMLDVRRWRPLVRWRFLPLTAEAEVCVQAMAADCPRSRLRSFGRMILGWSGVDGISCPVLSVHGDLDRMIPIRCAEPGLILEGAGHAFVLTHSERTSSAIQEFVAFGS